MNNLQLVKLQRDNKDYKNVKRLYITAFPKEERAPFFFLFMRRNRSCCDFYAAYLNNEWVGLTYLIYDNEFVYVFYLAVSENSRGKGAGSAILSEIKRAHFDKTVFLAIEEMNPDAENYPERVKRKAFYEHNGFHAAGIKLREVNVIYDVMTTGENVTSERFKKMMNSWLGKAVSKVVSVDIIGK